LIYEDKIKEHKSSNLYSLFEYYLHEFPDNETRKQKILKILTEKMDVID